MIPNLTNTQKMGKNKVLINKTRLRGKNKKQTVFQQYIYFYQCNHQDMFTNTEGNPINVRLYINDYRIVFLISMPFLD